MIRVGLVGFGMGGRVFHGPLISSVEGLELAAVLERSTDKGAERYPGITTYRTLEAMLADDSLGLFVVTTPSGTHFPIARQILEAGRNVVVDKPMSVTSAQVAELIALSTAQGVLLAPFVNRRWDSDFRTIQKLLHEGILGRIVYLESTFDRWRPAPPTDRLWKENPSLGGGVLLDLGTHLADQALALFGKPEAVDAEVKRERDGEGANDFFSIRLRYQGLTVTLASNSLSALARPRFHLRGTKGNYWKWGLDPQEAALNKITRIADDAWGVDPAANWGTLSTDGSGGTPVEPIPGDYRLYYAGIRDALLGKAPAPVTALAAWRVARLLEWAVESSAQRREILCDWSEEPA
jgi:scyllo-inositol 2-dehydrogenase (NADP+)